MRIESGVLKSSARYLSTFSKYEKVPRPSVKGSSDAIREDNTKYTIIFYHSILLVRNESECKTLGISYLRYAALPALA